MQRMTVTKVKGTRVRLVDQGEHNRVGRAFGGYRPSLGDLVAATHLNGELVIVCSWEAWERHEEVRR
jgi:hypothetical protein